eukprot:NODE_5526_length_575_cov_2.663462.p1 GENE.NODE_5526_length_575_cov_2.663462~~NODE_5526_length_575_cov_2.663462.p1  ORF type:complete len:160 (-),score=31.29 NODE_5526_length_575_cov_2.663462:11-490(-)
MRNASFRWEEDGETVLHDIDLDISRGELVMVVIVGKVGSGKSSLASALLGEVEKVKGTLTSTGRIGYCQQQAWIVNATVRENILFGSTYFEQEYIMLGFVSSLFSLIKGLALVASASVKLHNYGRAGIQQISYAVFCLKKKKKTKGIRSWALSRMPTTA